MRLLRYLILLSITIIGGVVNAQSQRELGQLMRERNEYYFILDVNKPSEIQAISDLCSVDGTDGRTVVCYANQQQYDRLLQAGYQPNLQTPPSLREEAKMWDGNRATYEWDSYPTYSQYESMMEAFPSSVVSGRTCTLITLGTLSSGRKIMGVRINNGTPEGKPKFLYSSTIHGDETTGWIMLLRLIDELCTSEDTQIVNLVNNLDIYIFPNTNPDGTYHGGNNTVTGARRANSNGVDLNRHFKDFVNGDHPDGASSYEPEAQWMMDFGQANLFTMAANYHGGAELMNYPYDCTATYPADSDWWELVCSEYVSLARQVYPSYMSNTFSSGVTNGANWYMIGGGRQDFMNYYAECREVTIECSFNKTLNASQLPTYWNYNHNSMLAFMEQCLKGVHGFVYDASTGQPIEGVTVTVQDHDALSSSVTTHAAGDFHRPIKGGSYTFAFEKEGYCPQFIEVTVADGQRVELNDIQLTQGYCMVPNFTASTTHASLGQSISFTDASYGTITSWSWTFEGASPSTSTDQNPADIIYGTAGDYDVTLIITDAEGNSDTLTKSDYIHVSESIIMQNGTVTTCDGLFYDSGGPDSNYGNYLDCTMTFYPATDGAKVSVSFTEFSLESNYDHLYIYDGNSTSAIQIGAYSGSTSPGTVTATNDAGALTFWFTSDDSVNKAGWAATVSCVYPEHTITLEVGWNWWSSYIELSDVDGLTMLEESLDDNGLFIKSCDAFVQYSGETGEWTGTLQSIDNESGYKIMVATECTSVISGPEAQASAHPITLGTNWNWIGYPVSASQDITTALSGFEPSTGDMVKGQEGYTVYDAELGWTPSDFVLNPSEGYMYYSTSTEDKTLVYTQGSKGESPAAETEECYWNTDRHAYPDNLSVMAVVEVEGEEQRDGALELGAFVDGECRGSARLHHVSSIDRYIAFLTVTGREGEQVVFRVMDKSQAKTGTSVDQITFHVNAIEGSLSDPLPIRFGTLTDLTDLQTDMSVYPNPVDRNAPFTLSIPASETVAELLVVNAMGEVVTRETGSLSHSMMHGLSTAGVYMVKVTCKSGKVYIGRVVVK